MVTGEDAKGQNLFVKWIHISFDPLLVVQAKCRDQLSLRVSTIAFLETFVFLNEQKDVVFITIYNADIGLRVSELATYEKAQVSPSPRDPIAFGVTESPEQSSRKVVDCRFARTR